MSGKLTKEFIAERDARIFQMKKSGLSAQQIARTLEMTPKAVNAAVQRQLSKLNREALMAYPEVLRMELERLDSLQASVWPLAHRRTVTLADGTETVVEPDLDAVKTLLSIFTQRAKLLGMDQVNLNVVSQSVEAEPQKAVLAEAASSASPDKGAPDEFSAQRETKRILELMAETGILDGEPLKELLAAADIPEEIVEAEIIEEDDNE